MDKLYELWYEEFDALSTSEKLELLNKYYANHNEGLDVIYKFDDNGLEDLLGGTRDYFDIIRMTYYGTVNMNHDYIRFMRNGGAFETLSRGDVEREADENAKGIYEEVNWHELIDLPIDED
jgi:hypothetical protein